MISITEPGVYSIPSADYHADPCPEPSLSASIAKTIWQKSPIHAWYASPRLNPRHEPFNKPAFDLGTACHDCLLEGGTGQIVVVEANDWRTTAAKEARADAYASGLTPLLPAQAAQVEEMAGIAMEYVKRTSLAGLFTNGKPEQTLIAQWNGTWLRSRLDWMTADRRIIVDYKTVGQSAKPEDFARTALFNMGHDIQAAMYTLMNGLTGGPKESAFVWLVQETSPPYACSLVGASPSVLDIGEHKLMHAIDAWQTALKTGRWPGYQTAIQYPDAPPWQLAQVEQTLYGDAA